MRRPSIHSIHLLKMLFLSTFLLCAVSSCISDNPSVISPDEFSKVELEGLGDQLWEALSGDSSPFEILSKEENALLYEHLETLYKQSYFILRAKQGWSTSRDWQIAIFRSENQSAFSFPGGNMMISTGMLESFSKEYELFYVMSFENTLMDSGYLFSNFISFVEDSIDIENLINEENEETALSLGIEMFDRLDFNALIVEETDITAMSWICESSSFRTDGISGFFSKLNEDSQWLNSRMSSINRLDFVEENFRQMNCGNSARATSLGNDYYVDEILPLLK